MTNGITNVGTTPAPVKTDPKEVASKVQGMFTEIMLKAMEDSVDAEDGLFGNSATSDIYRGMLREHLAGAISQRINSPLENVLGDALSNPKETGKWGRSPITRFSAVQENGVIGLRPHFPVPVAGVITSPEGWRRDPIDGEMRYHSGTDIAAPAGTPIQAVASGRVIESGMKNGYGNTVVIQTEDGRKMLYAHNNQNFVQAGDWVSRGDTIAEVGATGRATGPHVHFEVKFSTNSADNDGNRRGDSK